MKILYVILLLLLAAGAKAQDFTNVSTYLTYMNERMEKSSQAYMNYLSAVSHGKGARKVEKLRNKTVDQLFQTRMDIMGMPPFEKDKALRDATVSTLKVSHAVFNEDYGKIVNMEEIAEQSFDAMEAYLLMQEKAGEKLDSAQKERSKAFDAFAAAHNVTVVDNKDPLEQKLEQAGKVNKYHNKVYLIFFKSYKQEMYLTEALNKGDLNALEQARNALQTYANEGIAAIREVPAFQGDAGLKTACLQSLQYYKRAAEKSSAKLSAFLLAKQSFDKQKKAFDAMGNRRKKEDIDAFNKAVDAMNGASKEYNEINNTMNKERSESINGWNAASSRFRDAHIPYAKK